MANRNEYLVVARYSDGTEITAYHLQNMKDGTSQRFSRYQTIFLIGRNQIKNCSAQLYKDGVIIRGNGINLNDLKTLPDPLVKTSKEVTKPGEGFFKTPPILTLTAVIKNGKLVVGYLIKNSKTGKEIPIDRKKVLEYAYKKLVSNAWAQKDNKNNTYILRGLDCSLNDLPVLDFEEFKNRGKEKTQQAKSAATEVSKELIDKFVRELTTALANTSDPDHVYIQFNKAEKLEDNVFRVLANFSGVAKYKGKIVVTTDADEANLVFNHGSSMLTEKVVGGYTNVGLTASALLKLLHADKDGIRNSFPDKPNKVVSAEVQKYKVIEKHLKTKFKGLIAFDPLDISEDKQTAHLEGYSNSKFIKIKLDMGLTTNECKVTVSRGGELGGGCTPYKDEISQEFTTSMEEFVGNSDKYFDEYSLYINSTMLERIKNIVKDIYKEKDKYVMVALVEDIWLFENSLRKNYDNKFMDFSLLELDRTGKSKCEYSLNNGLRWNIRIPKANNKKVSLVIGSYGIIKDINTDPDNPNDRDKYHAILNSLADYNQADAFTTLYVIIESMIDMESRKASREVAATSEAAATSEIKEDTLIINEMRRRKRSKR